MSFAGEHNPHGRPSMFTRAQHLQALAIRREGKSIADIARRYGITPSGMQQLLRRAEQLEQGHGP